MLSKIIKHTILFYEIIRITIQWMFHIQEPEVEPKNMRFFQISGKKKHKSNSFYNILFSIPRESLWKKCFENESSETMNLSNI